MRRTVYTFPVWVIVFLLPAGSLPAQNIPASVTLTIAVQTTSSQPMMTPLKMTDDKKLRIAAPSQKKEKDIFKYNCLCEKAIAVNSNRK